MSTWTRITVEPTDDREIDPLELQLLLTGMTLHGVEVDRMHDGEAWDYSAVYDKAAGHGVEDRRTATAAGWSTYSIALGDEFEVFSRALGPGLRVTVNQEWDNDEPGSSEDVWVAGEHDTTASWEARPVSDALAKVNLTDPGTVAKILRALSAPHILHLSIDEVDVLMFGATDVSSEGGRFRVAVDEDGRFKFDAGHGWTPGMGKTEAELASS